LRPIHGQQTRYSIHGAPEKAATPLKKGTHAFFKFPGKLRANARHGLPIHAGHL
jgi:hypothetical protein